MTCLSSLEAVWLACAIDSEGHLGVTKATRRKTQYVLVPRVSISNTHRGFIDRASALIQKCGSSSCVTKNTKPIPGKKTVYVCGAYSQSGVCKILEEISPHLIIKQDVARAIVLWSHAREKMRLGPGTRPGRQGGDVPYGPETDLLLATIQAYREYGDIPLLP
jgi:hypothetical protein